MWSATDLVGPRSLAKHQFHPELRRAAFLIPQFSVGPKSTKFIRNRRERRPLAETPILADVAIRDEFIVGFHGDPLRVRIFSPAAGAGARPAMLWIHGGGFVIGHPEHDEAQNIEICRKLNIVVVSVNYRFGPDHPFPAPMDDCHAALAWLHANAEALNIDRARVAVAGTSAGGCLAAGLVLLAHDRGNLPIAFQLLVYPMLDDRTTLRTDVDERGLRIWSMKSNRFGWSTYLGREPGGEDVHAYSAPARRKDLSGLPPAWIGVGDRDLFHDEDVDYATRLRDAGVPCILDVVPGAFHAFDLVVPGAQVVADFRRSYFDALQAFASGDGALARPSASPERRLSAA